MTLVQVLIIRDHSSNPDLSRRLFIQLIVLTTHIHGDIRTLYSILSHLKQVRDYLFETCSAQVL